MSVGNVGSIKLSQLFKPVGGVVPSGLVTDGGFSATAQTYTNVTTILWNSTLLNTQGQIWEALNVSDATAGCRNAATPRTSGGSHIPHITEFEFLFTGLAFDIQFIGLSYYDMQVYIESDGRMYKLAANPLTGTTTGVMYRKITFAAQYHGRIRVVLAGGAFVGIKTEQSAIIKKPKDRIYCILDGGGEPAGVKQASGTSFLVNNIGTYLFEKTGFVWGQRGQPNTGFFDNTNATVTDDTAASDGSTRWFSQSRKDWMVNNGDFSAKPLVYLLEGTRRDGGKSSATGSTTGPMAVRAKACYDWIRSIDTLCKIIHVSPSPFTGAGSAGAVDGPPTAGNPHDLNRQEQTFAIGKTARAEYVNAFGPTLPWFSGTGSNGTPATSPQATLIGADGANFNQLGMFVWASRIVNEIGPMLVSIIRARGQR